MKMVYPGRRKKYMVLLIVLIGIFLAISSLAKIVPVTSMATYIDIEPYEGQEEYVETEEYTDEECTQIPYRYSISGERQKTRSMDTYQAFIGEFYVKNEEDIPGDFSFKYHFLTSKELDVIVGPTRKKTIPSGETIYFGLSYSAKEGEELATGNYVEHEIPTKKNCETVTKERNITKYRTVTKYRDVEKQRPETSYATLFEYLFVK